MIIAGYRSDGAGGRRPVNVWAPVGEIIPEGKPGRTIPLSEPFTTFFTSAPRGGSRASDTVDLFGVTRRPRSLHYARLRLPSGSSE